MISVEVLRFEFELCGLHTLIPCLTEHPVHTIAKADGVQIN